VQTTTAVATLYRGRPGFEGANIHTWIGFKHFMYQLEEAALDHARQLGLRPQRLFQDHGLCLETVAARARLLETLHMDDAVDVEVRRDRDVPGELALAVEMFVDRPTGRRKALNGRVSLLLRADGPATPALPPEAEALRHPVIARESSQRAPAIGFPGGATHAEARDGLPSALRAAHGGNAFVWPWRIPYFYCHYTTRLHFSGYVRLMEEVVDRFLADRGLSIGRILETRNWIPVVSDARLEILDEALLEETIYTVLTVEAITKAITWNARLDWYVWRAGTLLRTATGRITHGYVGIEGRSAGSLVTFDAETLRALQGGRA
jgi:acyl-CoA thioesterase FadM